MNYTCFKFPLNYCNVDCLSLMMPSLCSSVYIENNKVRSILQFTFSQSQILEYGDYSRVYRERVSYCSSLRIVDNPGFRFLDSGF